MSKRICKLFMAWDNDKEEQWLNDMSDKGMQLVKVSGIFYTFDEGKAGEYIYRLELLEDLPSSRKGSDYIDFMKDTGVEHIGSCMRWVYFRKKASEGKFDIYSDIDSQIKQNNRILILLFFAVLPLLCVSLITSIAWLWHGEALSDFQCGFVTGYSIVAVPAILIVLLGVSRVFRRRHLLAEEKKLRE